MFKFKNFEELKDRLNVPAEAVDFLKKLTVDTPTGRYDFGEDCYVNVIATQTKTEKLIMEAHEIYIDIQYLVSGEEKIYYIDKTGLEIKDPYVESGDCALYHFEPKSEAVTYKSGEGVVLYPIDAHLPGRCVNEPMKINKAVLKLKYKEN